MYRLITIQYIYFITVVVHIYLAAQQENLLKKIRMCLLNNKQQNQICVIFINTNGFIIARLIIVILYMYYIRVLYHPYIII